LNGRVVLFGRTPEETNQALGSREHDTSAGCDDYDSVVDISAGLQSVIPAVKQLGDVTAQHRHQGDQHRGM